MINWSKVEEDIFTMVDTKKIIEYIKKLIEKETKEEGGNNNV